MRLKATRYISDGCPNGATFEINDHDGEILLGLGHAKRVPEPKPKPAAAPMQPKAQQAYKTREMRAAVPAGTLPPTTPQP